MQNHNKTGFEINFKMDHHTICFYSPRHGFRSRFAVSITTTTNLPANMNGA